MLNVRWIRRTFGTQRFFIKWKQSNEDNSNLSYCLLISDLTSVYFLRGDAPILEANRKVCISCSFMFVCIIHSFMFVFFFFQKYCNQFDFGSLGKLLHILKARLFAEEGVTWTVTFDVKETQNKHKHKTNKT